MSVYEAGATAYRDTTKWLVAFVPIAAILTAGAVAGPRLIHAAGTAGSFSVFLIEYWLALLGLVAVAAGIFAVVWGGAGVLSAQPKDLGEQGSDELAKAFNDGVGAPYFFDVNGYTSAMASLQEAFDAKRPKTEYDLTLERAVAAVDALQQWSLHRELARSFGSFTWVFALGVLLILGGVAFAATTIPLTAGEITEPTIVAVELDSDGKAALAIATGCGDAETTVFWAISGTWDRPTLQADGDGCKFGAEWAPNPNHIEIRLPQDAESP